MGETQTARRGRHPYWQIAVLGAASLGTLWVGGHGGVRDLVAAGAVVLLMAGVFAILWRQSVRLATTMLLVTVILSPWLFGLTANTLQGWNDHVWLWGRYYNRSAYIDTTGGSETSESAFVLAISSTWLPSPSVVAGVSYAPTGVLFRMPDGTQLPYTLVGGP